MIFDAMEEVRVEGFRQLLQQLNESALTGNRKAVCKAVEEVVDRRALFGPEPVNRCLETATEPGRYATLRKAGIQSVTCDTRSLETGDDAAGIALAGATRFSQRSFRRLLERACGGGTPIQDRIRAIGHGFGRRSLPASTRWHAARIDALVR